MTASVNLLNLATRHLADIERLLKTLKNDKGILKTNGIDKELKESAHALNQAQGALTQLQSKEDQLKAAGNDYETAFTHLKNILAWFEQQQESLKKIIAAKCKLDQMSNELSTDADQAPLTIISAQKKSLAAAQAALEILQMATQDTQQEKILKAARASLAAKEGGYYLEEAEKINNAIDDKKINPVSENVENDIRILSFSLQKAQNYMQKAMQCYLSLEEGEAKQKMLTAIEARNAALNNTGKRLYELDKRYRQPANLLVEQNNNFGFQDTIIHRAEMKQRIASLGLNVAEANVKLKQANDPITLMLGVAVQSYKCVCSVKTYEKEVTAENGKRKIVSGKGVLIQDSYGQVYNLSSGELTEEQQGEIALKQAFMMLANYRHSRGAIVISGSNSQMGNKVYAALLLLRHAHPNLKDVKIKSEVEECSGPGHAWFKSNTEESYIKTHLQESVIEKTKTHLAPLLEITTKTKINRWGELMQFGDKGKTPEEQQFALKSGEVLEDDEEQESEENESSSLSFT